MSVDGTALEVMARHGRSFRWAAAFLGRAGLRDAARLYAFCRALDDLADHAPDPAAACERLESIARALNSGADPDNEPVLAGFRALAAERGVPARPASRLAAALAEDCGAVALPDEAALLRYAHGVAGTVGLMMLPLLGVRESPRAAPFALDLGIAMQFTNIARDVSEDAERGRLYLPATFLPPGVSASVLAGGDPAARPAAWSAIGRVLALAALRYRSAEHGFRFIPPRPRLAVATAARLYEAIGTRILRRGEAAYWSGRAVVGPVEKGWRTLGAVAAALRPGAGEPPHEAALHRGLEGLPGANPPAGRAAW